MKAYIIGLSLMFTGLLMAKVEVKELCTLEAIKFTTKTFDFSCKSGEVKGVRVPTELYNYLIEDLEIWSDNFQADVLKLELAGTKLLAYSKQMKFGASYTNLLSRYLGTYDEIHGEFESLTGKLFQDLAIDKISSLFSLGVRDVLTFKAGCPPKNCGYKVTVNHQ